ncbi:MAG TPA: nucleotide exchange factor GrpE [Firmicutes bacterium]|nr:nucleotide exchange factor GrpE [Bacillota bacterium]
MSKDNKQQNTQPPEEPAKEVPETEETSCPEGDPSQAPLPEETPEPSELEKAQAEIERLNDQLLRTLAEYDNYRKRSTREREALYPEAEAGILVKVLPVMDNFQRAMEAPCTDEKFKEGMEMILRAFQDTLKGLGVEEIGEEGEPFDPLKHNAVMHVEDDSLGENVVAQVLQKGYRRGDRVLRFAMVTTAN